MRRENGKGQREYLQALMKEGEADLRRHFLLIKDWMVSSRLN